MNHVAPHAEHPPSCWAVVVTYHPDLAALRRLVRVLDAEGVGVVIVDNASSLPKATIHDFRALTQSAPLVWLQNAHNLGIGAAQNRGVVHALAAGAEFLTLLDQDSLPTPNMVATLTQAWKRLAAAGEPVFAVGPRLLDEASGRALPFITYRHGIKRRVFAAADAPELGCFSLLASGTTLNRSAWECVGPLDVSLFLEYVDVEWGARARSHGLRSFGVPSATLLHNLGDARVRVGGRLSLPLHSAQRHYYTFRNAVLMQRKRHLPLYWKLGDLLRCLVTAPIFIACDKHPVQQARMIGRGVVHGLKGRAGALDQALVAASVSEPAG